MAIETEGAERTTPDVPIADVVNGLNDLLRLDHDAVASYEIAIEQLENRDHALQIEGFRQDHLTHIRRLNDLVVRFGGQPTNEPHATAPLKDAVLKAGGVAGDRGLLLAWRANELQSMAKYDRYAQLAVRWPADVKRVIDENALDEERHYGWVAELLGGSDGIEIDLLNRIRERMPRLRAATEGLRGRATHVGTAARSRAAGWLEESAKRLEPTPDGEPGSIAARGRLARGMAATAAILREDRPFDLGESVEKQVRSGFGRSLGVAFATGFLVGRILR